VVDATHHIMLRSLLSRRAFSTIRVNGRVYNKPLNSKPVLVINLSGTHRDYFLRARDADLMPNYDRIVMRESFRNTGLVATSMPTLPSTNLASILTGVQSDVHGITGNSYFDESSNRTVVFDHSSQLLCPTILSAFDQAGHRTVFLSVRQSQINLLGGNRTSNQSFSASVESLFSGHVKIPKLDALKAPDARSPDASIFCIDLASKMIEQDLNSAESKAPVYFVSTDDTLQRQHEHGEPQANEFMAKLDDLIGRLDSTGIRFAIVGDHSLNHKMLFSKGKEEINIVYLQPLLEQGKIECHLSLPIETLSTPSPDSQLGSFAMLYLKDKSKENVMNAMKARFNSLQCISFFFC
jgi:phosphonoacetate hydrolase